VIAAGPVGGAGLAKWLGLAASPTFAAMAQPMEVVRLRA